MATETTTTLSEETLDHLQQLIRINFDSRDGFREAAKRLDDAEVASLFESLAEERELLARDLQHFVVANNEEPEHRGSFAAAVHRTWMGIRERLSGDAAYAVLAEAERGEDTIKRAYEETLKRTAGSAVNDVLQKQYVLVKRAHDRVRDLRDLRGA